MEYVEGRSLRELLASGPVSHVQAAELVAQVAEAVHFAHGQGLVHRDLKPGNILIDALGHPHVVDFGLAVHEREQAGRGGEISGTPAYMSPEQVHGEARQLDGRTDVWSLGVILYEMLTRRQPFSGASDSQVFDQILNRQAGPPRQIDAAIPKELEQVCLKAMSKEPTDRYSTALDLAAELRLAVSSPEAAASAGGAPAAAIAQADLAARLGLGKRGSLAVIALSGLVFLLAAVAIREAVLVRRVIEIADAHRADADAQRQEADAQRAFAQQALVRLGVVQSESDEAIAQAQAREALHKSQRAESERREAVQQRRVAEALAAGREAREAELLAWKSRLDVWSRQNAGIAASPDGRLVAVLASDKRLRLFDWAKGVEVLSLPASGKALAFSPDGRLIAAAARDELGPGRGLTLWDVATGKQVRKLAEGVGDVESLAFSPDGRQLMGVSRSGALTVWDVVRGIEIRGLPATKGKP